MEQHAIPRQITSFEFKLIGFMTLRQFLYLVVAFPVAYIVYVLFPIPFFNVLLAVIVAGAGLLTAFFPYQDRSLDIWARNLWKRLQNPTQYYYHKHNDPLYFLKDLYFLADPHHMLAHIESKEKLSQYLAMTRQKPRVNYQKKQIGALLQAPSDTLQKHTDPIVPTDQAPVQAVHTPSPAMQDAMKVVAMPPTPIAPAMPPAPAAPLPVQSARPAGPQSPLIPINQLVNAPSPAPQQVMMQTEVIQPAPAIPMPIIIPPASPPPVVLKPQAVTPRAVVVPPPGGNPPFFSGVVRTSKRIPVPGILVYIKDNSGNPLRLMKSNPHGVFATFNPLTPGDYTFEIKDPTGTYFFDTMKVPVNETNSIPVEFMSKEIL